ncbi:MAG: T9SS type A sorting domain-containing protein [Bacteroidales bacterium]|jgi:hypothetical protein|nr:T9SS type A sorting domain-containing protein [Bacteroidales bacterium]
MLKAKFFFKKLALVVLVASAFSAHSFGQVPNITPEQIQYWVGSGSNETIFIINFCNASSPIALAWGYRWNGASITAATMVNAIVAADDRLTVGAQDGKTYQDAVYGTMYSGGGDLYSVNDLGFSVTDPISNQLIVNGDFLISGGIQCLPDPDNWFMNPTDLWTLPVVPATDPNGTAPTDLYTVHAVNSDEYGGVYGAISPAGDSTVAAGSSITYYFTPDAGYHLGSVTLGSSIDVTGDVANSSYTLSNIQSDSTITVLYAIDKNNALTQNDILYWVGEGSNKVIFAVNWCEKSLAWGYRFSADSVLVSDIFSAIKAADSRFNYTFAGDLIQTVTYTDNINNLSITGGNWVYNVNEEPVMNFFTQQWVRNNDEIESGDYGCALSDNFGNFVWTAGITPVSTPVNIVSPNNDNVKFALYPNPAKDYIYLSINGIEGDVFMQIVDISGKAIMAQQFVASSQTVKNLDISTLTQGAYFVTLQNRNSISTKKIMVY